MNPKIGFLNPPVKLKSFKNDLAPIGFFLDIFSSELFEIPVMPIPMRIDNLTNGIATFFIIPDFTKLNILLERLDLVFDFYSFITQGIHNLIIYAKRKYKEITYRTLPKELIIKWFENSLNLTAEILSLKQDFTFITSEFLKIYSKIEKKQIEINSKDYYIVLTDYCEVNIKYFRDRIENNQIKIFEKGVLKTVELYKEKRSKYYPELIPIEVKNLKMNKVNKLTFVPYLIYDDILDCFTYNKKLLDDAELKPLNMTTWKNYGIINKRSNIDNSKYNYNLKNFNLKNIKLEILL